MKITFVLGNWMSLRGGVRVVAEHAKNLMQRGHDVFVVSPGRPQPTWKQQLRSLLKGQGWISRPKNLPSHFDNTDIPRQILNHPAPVTDADVPDADVVVAGWWETAEWVANLSTSKGAKAYFIQNYEMHDYLPKEKVEATFSLPLHKITHKWLADLMATQYGDPNCSVLPNGVNTKQFNAPSRQKQAVPTVGLLYSQVYWKGCDISLKALSIAAQKIPNLHLVVFSSEDPSPDLPLPPETEYYKKPPQSQIKDIYAKCDVWLCGSLKEGFHLPPLEAMACRCPVVSTRVSGPMDTVTDGVNGYIVPVGDFTALAERLVDVLSLSDTQWKVMSDAAYETAHRYTWDYATDLLEAALHTAIERQKRGDFS
ncbi:glycosyl transferases group 1 family protein [Lyngbya aestuarii BL J]|uniref:Glycosyl transferases group 1 family protein n=1 Tax=Lyngbya aestuarii BL J TaxID=1348334 RepID=U7QRT7_9CYAN|nr:glycosyltransferase family 4 protein [Lyngbya aestuarii]ERT09126.1 glycosyl transferases group 1 family protein [Lyngbya aestuarii BL J]